MDMNRRIVAENPFKTRLQDGRGVCMGFWSSLANPLLAELVAEHQGIQWMLFDAEHAPNDVHSLLAQLQAIRFSAIPAVVRPLRNHPAQIKRLLDIGFRNLLIPSVQSAQEAQEAVLATRYPPEGVRGVSGYHRNNGYGRISDYFEYIDSVIAVIVQIESRAAMDRLEDIAAVQGIDALFVGPGDLAASLGCLGQIRAAPVQDAICSLGRRASALGCKIGITAGSMEDVARYRDWGYSLFTVGSDVQLFRQAVERLSSDMLSFD